MAKPTTVCPQHGPQGMGFACIHVARAIDSGEQVGFFSREASEMDRPWAWCRSCEAHFVATNEDWKEIAAVADFKLLCSACWDEAKRVLFHGSA